MELFTKDVETMDDLLLQWIEGHLLRREPDSKIAAQLD